MDSITLRQASPSLITELTRLVQAYYRYDSLVYDVSVERAIADLVNDTRFGNAWLIEIDGDIGGYLILTAAFDIEFGGSHGIVTDFFLEERHRGRGVGLRIMSLVEDEARRLGYRAIELSVTKSNFRARKLYDRVGFVGLNDRDAMVKRL
ncbi:MAG: GNAT family N-acetyltransferase [Fimbriimonas sp.]|nr:GNAT family N-acetyltransferase [Fimbriimonas sp.]